VDGSTAGWGGGAQQVHGCVGGPAAAVAKAETWQAAAAVGGAAGTAGTVVQCEVVVVVRAAAAQMPGSRCCPARLWARQSETLTATLTDPTLTCCLGAVQRLVLFF
jgi:hypothetical protein